MKHNVKSTYQTLINTYDFEVLTNGQVNVKPSFEKSLTVRFYCELSMKNCHEMKSLGASLECMKKQLTPSTSVFCFQLCDSSQSGNDPQK